MIHYPIYTRFLTRATSFNYYFLKESWIVRKPSFTSAGRELPSYCSLIERLSSYFEPNDRKSLREPILCPGMTVPPAVRCSHASRDPTTSFLVESTIVFERLVPLVLLLAIQRPSDPISRLLQKVIWRSPPVTDSHSNE